MTPVDCRSYDDLIEAIRARIDELGCPLQSIDDMLGVSTGLLAKAIGPSRTKVLGTVSLFRILEVLGLRVELSEHLDRDAAIEEMGVHYRERVEHFRRPGIIRRPISADVRRRVIADMARRGSEVALAITTPSQRRAWARKAGLASGVARRPIKRKPRPVPLHKYMQNIDFSELKQPD